MLLTILYVGVRRADEARRKEFAARLEQAERIEQLEQERQLVSNPSACSTTAPIRSPGASQGSARSELSVEACRGYAVAP